ncbi:MAG: HAMP domain-containing protein, partial [Pseudomonadota bacterium]
MTLPRQVLSLFAVVFSALLVFGWLLDQLYLRIAQPEQHDRDGYDMVMTLAAAEVERLLPDRAAADTFLGTLELDTVLEELADLPLPEPLQTALNTGAVVQLESDAGVTWHKRAGAQPWVLSMGPLAPQAADDNTRYWMTLLFYSGIGAVLFIWITPLVRATRQLEHAVKRIGQGELGARVDTAEHAQLATLKSEFNAMAEKLQRASEQNALFSQAISHELRTPL